MYILKHSTSNLKIWKEWSIPRHILVKLLDFTDKEKIYQSFKTKRWITYKSNIIRIARLLRINIQSQVMVKQPSSPELKKLWTKFFFTHTRYLLRSCECHLNNDFISSLCRTFPGIIYSDFSNLSSIMVTKSNLLYEGSYLYAYRNHTYINLFIWIN